MSSSGVVRSPLVSYVKAGIDGTVLASTSLFTTEATLGRFYPLEIIFETTATDTVVSVALTSIGTNATSYNNVLAITTLTGVNANNIAIQVPIVLATTSIAASTAVFAKVTTAAVATTYTLRITTIGYYL